MSETHATTVSFPTYFLASALKSTAWPRKLWFLGRPVVLGDVFALAWIEMARASVGLGAARPVRACQLLTQLFGSRDWENSSADGFLAELDEPLAQQRADMPWQAIVDVELGAFAKKKYFSMDDLFSDRALLLQSFRCGQALSYGILHPREAGEALDRERAARNAAAAVAIAHGLLIPSIPAWTDNRSYYDWVGELLQVYETRHGSLPASHPSLISSQAMRERLSM